MHKKTLFLVIDNLKKGGAELLLVSILHELNKKFSVILVTLSDDCDFKDEEIPFKKRYTLGFTNKFSIISCIRKLKKIINDHKPSLIHSHLYYSSLIARSACPSTIPLLYTLHGEMSKNVFNNSQLLTFLEKNTIKANQSVIAVSDEVLRDYKHTIKKNNQAFVLKNYISDVFFQHQNARIFSNFQKLQLVAVGNIKRTKNYIYLIKALEKLSGFHISLDIYGDGNDKDLKTLKKKIQKKNVTVILKGPSDHINQILPQYDLYVCCSKHEGFGIAVVEAMASGLPLLLSDLPVFHEVTHNNALFFDVENPDSFVELMHAIFEKKHDLNNFSSKGIEISKIYKKENYLTNLFAIYEDVLKTSI